MSDVKVQVNHGAETAVTVSPAANIAVQIAAGPSAQAVQAQLDQIVLHGDSSVEAAQARVNAGGTTYGTLKARLDASDAQMTANAEAPPVAHTHGAGDIATGILAAIRGGTGYASLAELLTALVALGCLTLTSTTSMAATSTLGTVSEFILCKIGRVVFAHINYSSLTKAAGYNADAAIIPVGYRPLYNSAVSLYVPDNTEIMHAFVLTGGGIGIRVNVALSASSAFLDGVWITA